jgi:hypothetical protein
VQGEAEGVKNSEQLTLLQDFYRDRLALLTRHVEGARAVSDYDFNNTYQYVIERENAHVTWARAAIEDLGGEVPTNIPVIAVPSTGKALALQAAVLDDDVRQAQAFHERWRDRAMTVTNARHRGMLAIVLGEVLEHKRFFEQAKAGREDLLGTRLPGASTGDGVLPTRWLG